MDEAPRNFSFMSRDSLWDEDEVEKQVIHDFVANGEDVLTSFRHKVARRDYLIDQERRRRSPVSFYTFTSAKNMMVRKLRSQRLDRVLRPYWEWLLDRLNYECQMCRGVFNPGDFEVDHCCPLSKGGKNEWNNIQPLCAPCNRRKNAKKYISDAVLSAQKEWKAIQRREQCQKKP